MLLRLIFAVLLLAAWRPDAYALHHVTTCGETCTNEQCILDNSMTCSTNPFVTLNTGADFDFNGKKITCTTCNGGSQAVGVVVNAANSTIDDSVGGGGLVGYPIGIDCNYQSNSFVKNVHIDGTNTGTNGPSTAIDGCRKVQGAVITNMKSYGIVNQDIGDSDYIKDSFIVGSTGSNSGIQYGIWLDGSGSGTVDHNVFANFETLGILAFYTASGLELTNNIFFAQYGGGAPIGTGIHTPIMSGNVCGDPAAEFNGNCNSCVEAGACQGATQPLSVP